MSTSVIEFSFVWYRFQWRTMRGKGVILKVKRTKINALDKRHRRRNYSSRQWFLHRRNFSDESLFDVERANINDLERESGSSRSIIRRKIKTQSDENMDFVSLRCDSAITINGSSNQLDCCFCRLLMRLHAQLWATGLMRLMWQFLQSRPDMGTIQPLDTMSGRQKNVERQRKLQAINPN